MAAWLAWRASRAGHSVDRRLVEAAALLHDLDKLPSVKAALSGLRHAEGSAKWLAERGCPELGPVITGHPVTRLADGGWFESWFASASVEQLIVSYADKRAGQRLESMTQRFDGWRRRYPPAEGRGSSRDSWSTETMAAVWSRAQEIEKRACRLAGVRPQEVRRLHWTNAALKAAAASPTRVQQ